MLNLKPTTLAVVGALGLAFLYLVVSSIISHFRHRARAKKLGCEPAFLVPVREPSGLLDFIESASALSNKELPALLLRLQNDLAAARGFVTGTIRIRLPVFSDALFTTDPKNIQAMLALQFKEFELGANRRNNFYPLLGNGIFASDGKQWEHSRALLRPQFTRAQISDLDMEERHVQTLLRAIEHHVGPDKWTDVVDLQVLFFRLTLDSATEFLFGESVHTQLESIPGAVQSKHSKFDFASAFDKSQGTLAFCGQLGPNYWVGHTPGFRRNCKRVHNFVDHFVQMAIAQEKGEKPKDDKYVFLRALAEQTKNPEELRAQLLNILLAGRDTTASLLGWLFYTLGQEKNAAIFEKLRKLVIEDFGTYSKPKELSFTSLKSCQYLQWCLNEALRVYPVVPVNVRTPNKDTTLPTGGGPDGTSPIYVRKGQDVAYSVFLMHRRKDIWGEDADEYRPERWQSRKPGWEYLPFNGGPRICIGQQFALTEASYVVVRLLQRVDAIDGTTLGPEKHGLTLTDCPGEGVKVRLRFTDQ